MPSSTSLLPSFWPASTVEMLIRLRCRQSRPQAVTGSGLVVVYVQQNPDGAKSRESLSPVSPEFPAETRRNTIAVREDLK
jgi:hypothetical protein